jgi:hypothetical protein
MDPYFTPISRYRSIRFEESEIDWYVNFERVKVRQKSRRRRPSPGRSPGPSTMRPGRHSKAITMVAAVIAVATNIPMR